MKWTEEKTGRGWGVKGVTENGRERARTSKLLMGKEGRGGVNKRVGQREGGTLVWAEALLNEEAAEPFLLLSNCMLLCLCSREGERAS